MTGHEIDLGGLRLHYRDSGEGSPVLLLHGWPTSSFLWREVGVPIARSHRVVAVDLPGFGHSDKPLDVSYSFRYFTDVLDRFVEGVGLERPALVVHDLGGPVGLHWALRQPDRVSRLALLNTLVYPEASWAVVAFLTACRLPIVRSWLTGPSGLAAAMRIGMHDHSRITPELLDGVRSPFVEPAARRALLAAGTGLSPKGLREIAERLPSFRGPVRLIYGERDRILPDVARTMARVARDLPQAETTALPDCGHFLQEDRPDEVGRLLAEFLAE